MSKSKTITGFKFIWDDKQKLLDNFDGLVEPFFAKFTVENTGEVVEFTKDTIGKVLLLKRPFELEKSDPYPFGRGNDAQVHIYDRPVNSGYSYKVDVKLADFFLQNESVPTIMFNFGFPAFCVNAWDSTQHSAQH